MPGYRFRRNMHISFRGREYVIEERLPDGDIRLRDVAFDECRPVAESDLVDAWFNNELEFLGDSSVTLIQRKLAENFVDDLNMLDKDDPRRTEAKRRFAYLKALDKKNLDSFTREAVQPVIDEVYEAIKDTNKPHWKTLCYRWKPPWEASGRDLRALAPHYDKRGNTKAKFCARRKRKGEKYSIREKRLAQEVRIIVAEVIDEVYMTNQRLPVGAVCDALDIRINDENRLRDPGNKLPVPKPNSIYNILTSMDEYEKDKARLGKAEADRKHRSNKQGAVYTRPLQRVEMDDTTLDLFVVDPDTRLPIGRPTLSYSIDRCTRMSVGFHMGFDGPGYLAVMQCLLHAVSRKTYLKELFPMVQNDWPVYGVPDEAVVDNGSAYVCEDFTDACSQLGTTVIHAPVHDPDAKGGVETFFGTENDKLLHRLPGTTFSDIFDRGDYDPEKNAVISFDALMAMTHVFMVDIYARDWHRGLEGVPAVAWERGVELYPPPLPRRMKDLRIILGHGEERIIGPSGVEFENLHYNCPELAALRDGKREFVKFKYNPTDISVIYVYDSRNDRYIHTPALNYSYAKGLSLWQHKVIKRYVRNQLEELVNVDSLRHAKKIIQMIVEDELLKSNRSGTRVRLMRWRGIRQPDYNAMVEMEAEPNPAQLEAKDGLLLLNSGDPTAEGISDLGQTPVDAGQTDEPSSGVMQLPSGIAMTTAEAEKTKAARKPRKTAKKGADMSRPAVAAGNTGGEDGAGVAASNDDDLDMTGFSSSYDLPAEEA
jgi:putative transposase